MGIAQWGLHISTFKVSPRVFTVSPSYRQVLQICWAAVQWHFAIVSRMCAGITAYLLRGCTTSLSHCVVLRVCMVLDVARMCSIRKLTLHVSMGERLLYDAEGSVLVEQCLEQ